MDRSAWEHAKVVEVRGDAGARSDRPHVLTLLPDYQSSEDHESTIYEVIERLGADGWELTAVAAASPTEVIHWLKRPTDAHWLHRPQDSEGA